MSRVLSDFVHSATKSLWAIPALAIVLIAATGHYFGPWAAAVIVGVLTGAMLGLLLGLHAVPIQSEHRPEAGAQAAGQAKAEDQRAPNDKQPAVTDQAAAINGGNAPAQMADTAEEQSEGSGGGDFPERRRSQSRAADLRGAVLTHAILREADLRRADLRGADLRGADLTGANLAGALLGELEG